MTSGAEICHLVEAARSGDRAAFDALHRRFAAMVHGIVLAHGPMHEADDLTQRVFLRAYETLHSLREPERFGGWLATIARRMATTGLRERRPQPLRLRDDEVASRDDDTREEALRLLATIRGLPDAYRETLILRLVEGLTGPQIAAATGRSHGTVRVNLNRGMKLLREALGLSDAAEEVAR